MIPLAFQKNTRFVLLGVSGILLALSGYLILTFDPLNAIVHSMLRLSPGSVLFNIWSKPPYEVIMNAYIFNVTNYKEFLKGEKLKVEEVGPYAYQEILSNENATFNDDGTITFSPKRQLIFRRDLSIGDPKVDVITSPNIILLGISSYLQNSMFLSIGLTFLANSFKSKLFLNLTIEEYLWGYDDPLVTAANTHISSWINFSRFGIMERLMALDNDSNVVTIENKPSADIYKVLEFNGSPGLPLWGYNKIDRVSKNNTPCNTLSSTYVEGLFPPDAKAPEKFRLYRRAFCKPVGFEFEEEDTMEGYETLRYRMSPTVFATPDVNADNACFCEEGKCLKSGFTSISPCYYGIPISISQPHYYNADKSVLDEVEGLKPDRELHDSTFKIHKYLGAPLSGDMKVQINLHVNNKYMHKIAPFQGKTLPLFWLQLKCDKIPDLVKFVLTSVYHVLPVVQKVASYLFMLLGVAMVACAALFTIYSPKNFGLEDPFDGRIGYSPIRIIPVAPSFNPPTIRIRK